MMALSVTAVGMARLAWVKAHGDREQAGRDLRGDAATLDPSVAATDPEVGRVRLALLLAAEVVEGLPVGVDVCVGCGERVFDPWDPRSCGRCRPGNPEWAQRADLRFSQSLSRITVWIERWRDWWGGR